MSRENQLNEAKQYSKDTDNFTFKRYKSFMNSATSDQLFGKKDNNDPDWKDAQKDVRLAVNDTKSGIQAKQAELNGLLAQIPPEAHDQKVIYETTAASYVDRLNKEVEAYQNSADDGVGPSGPLSVKDLLSMKFRARAALVGKVAEFNRLISDIKLRYLSQVPTRRERLQTVVSKVKKPRTGLIVAIVLVLIIVIGIVMFLTLTAPGKAILAGRPEKLASRKAYEYLVNPMGISLPV